MKGYSVGQFPREAIEAWRKAELIVRSFVEYPDELLRCHEVARAVFVVLMDAGALGTFAAARVVDGWYAGADHSWIELRPGIILDPSAVARAPMVQLVDTANILLQSRLFSEEEKRTDIRSEI